MTRMRIAMGLITAAALVLLFVLVRPGGNNDEETTTTATEPNLTQSVSKPTVKPTPEPATVVWQVDTSEAKIARKTIKKGTRLTLVVTANTSEEVHVHGYDLKRDVAPGKPAKISFHADIPGRFDIELEHAGKQIAELTVTP
jgi:hypothetical protein